MESIRDWIEIEQVMTRLVAFLPKLALAIIVFLFFLLLYRITRTPIQRGLKKAGFHETLVHLMVANIYRYAVILVGLVMAVDQLGVNVTAAIAGLGIAGIAIGFAAQDSVANVISGILIFWDKPFIVGDWITVESQYGCVSEITLRSTRIRTPRNTYVVIPNKRIIDAVLENYSKHGETRVDVPIGIAYKEDIRRSRQVLLAALGKVDGIRAEPAPDVIVEELGNSSVNLKVRVWIDSPKFQHQTLFNVIEESKIALDAAGIQIPFPHLQLFVDNVEDRVWQKATALAGRS